MKIEMVNSYFPPWRGGAETYAYNLSRALVRRGHEVTVHCGGDPLPSGLRKEEGIKILRHKVIARAYGTPIMPTLLTKLTHENPDILHGNFPSPYIAFAVATASRTRRIPAVLTWHNDLPPITPAAAFLIRTHDRLFIPRYLPTYRRIISTSSTYASRSRILRDFHGAVRIVPNGVDCKRFNPTIDGQATRRRLRLGDKFTILFVGALTKWHGYKGLDVLLHAFRAVVARNTETALIVVGDGELKTHYARIAEELAITENVKFIGNVDDEALPAHYSASDVLVLPSKDMSEGFGLTILEANATGKPVVASNVGGIPSVVRQKYNGLLVPPNNTQSLSEALLYLAENRDWSAFMGKNGRKLAESNDWSQVASLTERIYHEALTDNDM
jgi:glycosyltransferase involved in cell wall biosynthesis